MLYTELFPIDPYEKDKQPVLHRLNSQQKDLKGHKVAKPVAE